jgi:hypothetical protein
MKKQTRTSEALFMVLIIIVVAMVVFIIATASTIYFNYRRDERKVCYNSVCEKACKNESKAYIGGEHFVTSPAMIKCLCIHYIEQHTKNGSSNRVYKKVDDTMHYFLKKDFKNCE